MFMIGRYIGWVVIILLLYEYILVEWSVHNNNDKFVLRYVLIYSGISNLIGWC